MKEKEIRYLFEGESLAAVTEAVQALIDGADDYVRYQKDFVFVSTPQGTWAAVCYVEEDTDVYELEEDEG